MSDPAGGSAAAPHAGGSQRASVTIVVPTLNRPGPLARALTAIGEQAIPTAWQVDAVVVDNSPTGNAAPVVAAADLPVPVTRVHVPAPGIATARNAGVAAARGAVIAFVDDDCEPGPHWLVAQVGTLLATGADASFGPRVARIEGAAPPDAAFFTATYSRDLGAGEGADVTRRHAHLPLPGAAFVAERCLAGAPFDLALDAVGAEDVLLFRRLADAGRRFVWSPRATMVEWIPASRCDAAFVLTRRYVSGQHRCLVPLRLAPPRRTEVALHMATGAAAVALAVPLASAARIAGRRVLPLEGLAQSGLGKLTFWRKRRPALYGVGHR